MEKLFLILTIYTYAISSVTLIIGLVFDKPAWRNWGRSLIWIGLVANSFTIGIRWYALGHGPYISRYEVLLSNAWVATALYLLVSRIWKILHIIGAVVMPIIFLGLGAAILSPVEAVYLSPAQRSSWLIIHISFAKLTTGSIVVATALSLVYLLKERTRGFEFLEKLPPPERCDELSYKMAICAFLFTGVMLISGSIWGNQLWGRYWGWDPLETWSLVVWLVYGLFLHLRITFRFKGERSAWYIIFAFCFTVLSFFILPYMLDTIHNVYMVE